MIRHYDGVIVEVYIYIICVLFLMCNYIFERSPSYLGSCAARTMFANIVRHTGGICVTIEAVCFCVILCFLSFSASNR